jgi:hypothetical protein
VPSLLPGGTAGEGGQNQHRFADSWAQIGLSGSLPTITRQTTQISTALDHRLCFGPKRPQRRRLPDGNRLTT